MKILILALIMSSCSALRSVSQTNIPKNKKNKVKVSATRDIVFLFNFDNDYVDTIAQKLIEKCPKGSVRGITTKDEMVVYFPLIYHKSIVTAEGYCVR